MTGVLQAVDPEFERRVRESFARQRVMATIGARLARSRAISGAPMPETDARGREA